MGWDGGWGVYSHLFCYTDNENETCGGMITDRSGLITAPDNDEDGFYDFNVECVWLIKVASDSVIVYQILDVEIGEASTDSCEGDVLSVSTTGRIPITS